MEKQELIQKIKNILVQIRPYLAADGGGAQLVEQQTLNLWVEGSNPSWLKI